MTSQLASQLQRLQQRPDESRHRLAKSFLFSSQDAQSFSREQIHQLALNGLQTLIAMDNRFHRFLQDLFDVKCVRQERSMLASTEDAALRARLDHLLTLLSPHLFLTAAQQVFEYLVRVFEVHIYDVQAVLRAFLPYHDHNIFARALLLLDLRDTGFDFLATNQLRGAPLLREHLVLACAESRKAARLVCLTVAMPFRYEVRHHAANALFAGVVTQLATHKDAEALWRTFLPFVLELLSGAVSDFGAAAEASSPARVADDARDGGSRVSAESVATALVVLAAWATQVRFSSSMLTTLLKPLFRYVAAAAFAAAGEGSRPAGAAYLPVRDLLALLEVLFATQHRALADVSVVPLLQSLLALPWRTLVAQLPFAEATEVVTGHNGVPTTSPRHSALLATLLHTALERLSRATELRLLPADVLAFLECAAEDLPLSNAMAARYLRVVMTAEAGDSEALSRAADASKVYHRVIAALERRYAIVFDGVLSEVLLRAETSVAATAFLARHFRGTRYGMVEVGSALATGVTESLPLFACLLHPVPEVRALAAKMLEGMTADQLLSTAGGQSLADLLTHVMAYEHHTTAAAAFVATTASILKRLTALWAADKSASRDSAACCVACELVRAAYAMALASCPAAGSSSSSAKVPSSSASVDGQRRVVQPLIETVLQSTVLQWTTGATTACAASTELRATALYHTTLLYVQWHSAAAPEVVTAALAVLDGGCGGASAVAALASGDSRAVASAGRAAGNGSSKLASKRAADSDSDEEGSSTAAPAAESKSGAAAAFAGLVQCPALLSLIRAEAQRRLPDAFAAARTALREAAGSETTSAGVASEAEVVVALAAALLPAVTEASSSSPSSSGAAALQAVSAASSFLHGSPAAAGYLDIMYEALLKSGNSSSNAQRAATVGRGAVDATAAARAALSVVPLVVSIGLVLRTALTRAVAAALPVAELVLRLCEGLGSVGAPLPSIAQQPDVLAPAYLELVNASPTPAQAVDAANGGKAGEASASASAARQVDWYGLVADAVFRSVEASEDRAPATTLAAVTLALLLPLRAPSSQRLAQLRALQDAVVTAGARRGKGRMTGVQFVLAAALQPQGGSSSSGGGAFSLCSVTALSCLIECMAVEEKQYQLTTGAAALLCALLTVRHGAAYALPAGWAHRAIRYFFRAPGAGSASGSAALTPQLMGLVEALLPRVEAVLTCTGEGAAASSAALRDVSADAADFVDAVCSRLQLWGGDAHAAADGAAADPSLDGNASVRLVELLLRHPHVHVQHGGGARSVYRHALTALAAGLSEGLEERRGAQATIFTNAKGKKRPGSADKAVPAMSPAYQRAVAARLQPVLLRAMDTIGSDVAVACVGTRGGYEYVFLHLVAAAEAAGEGKADEEQALSKSKAKSNRRRGSSAGAQASTMTTEVAATPAVLLQRVREMLETLVPSTGTASEADAEAEEGSAAPRWRPPPGVVVATPLTFADALRVLRLPRVCAAASADSSAWTLSPVSLEGLWLLRTLLLVLPTIVMDDDEDGESVFALVMRCVEAYPLQEMETLLRQAATSASTDDVAMLPRVQQLRLGARGSVQVEAVLRLVETLVHVCTEQTRLLSESVADGAYRVKSRLLRELMVLMARVLVDESDDSARQNEDRVVEGGTAGAAPAEGERRQSELHFHVDTIAGLLRAMAPLLKMPAGASAATTAGVPESITYLHIPLVSLLMRLEAVDNTEALGFRSAREVCQEILTSFDVRTQVQCLAQLMRLVADPAAQLSGGDAEADAEQGDEAQRVQHLFRRMVKPNQVINRQETIMHLVNLTVKSDLFLEPFLALQRHARSSMPSRATRASGAQRKREKEKDASDGEEDAIESGSATVQREDGGCMELLVSALELFAHYHDLHDTTRSATSAASAAEAAEAEAYTALLELLAGNTLACVLAGINEPTFVVCQQRLLEDRRAALRRIGLEVLLDRLHHSLPTLENVISDDEMEAHRRRLRDPRQRLSLTDLVRIKARPLTTKRSVQLLPLLVAEVKANLAAFHTAVHGNAAAAEATGELLSTAQLGVASVEELIRIVSSGGSLQAEKTLLNANRSKRVTETALVKLFGNRSRVGEVREVVDLICDHWMPLLTRCEIRLRTRGAVEGAGAAAAADVEAGVLSCVTCLVTALATMTQVMGTAFASPHCLSLLHTLVSAGVHQVVEMPGIVARSEAGALLRHSTLSALIRCFPACWQMTQPYLPSLLFLATHLTNVTDAETHYLCAEMLAVLEAVMEPQLLLDAATACLQGMPYLNGAVVPAAEQHQLADLAVEAAAAKASARKRGAAVRARQLRVQVHTHSFVLLFTCIERRIENLAKDELLHMPTLTDGTTPQQNFWLAAFQSLASAPTVPSSEAVMPVLQAFTVFLLKFKAKHGMRLLRLVADWAFAESSGGVSTGTSSRRNGTAAASAIDASSDDGAGAAELEERQGRGHDGAPQSLSRVTLQSWIMFFALSNHLLGKLGSILDFAFPVLLPHAVTALRTFCAATATAAKATDSLIALVLEGALECVRSMAVAQTPGADHDYSIELDVYFANPDVFPSVMPALVHQLHNLQYLEDSQHDYRFRVERNVIPAVRAFMACLGSSKLQSKTQAEVVRALRHPSRHVRREALVCLDGIYADGGDELASRLMAEMLPTVVELTEDRDDAVVEEARKLSNNLSHMTGQDVLYAMS